MATSIDYIEFVIDSLAHIHGELRYKKMFSEYCVYLNERPILLVCDNTVYIKILPCLEPWMSAADKATPYDGAKERYVLDMEDSKLLGQVIPLLEQHTPIPKPRKAKIK